MTTARPQSSQPEGEAFFLEAGSTGVLLLHSLGSAPTEVRRLGRSLNRAGFSVAAPLLPGHGQAQSALSRTSWQDWLAEAGRAYAHLSERCEHVFAGGEGTGALLALLLAARQPATAGLLAYAPSLDVQLSRMQSLSLPLLAQTDASVPRAGLPAQEAWPGFPEIPLKAVFQHRRLEAAVQAALAQVTQPLLLVQGRLDGEAHRQAVQDIYDGAQSAVKELLWLEQTGHYPLLEKEAPQVNLATLNFLYKTR